MVIASILDEVRDEDNNPVFVLKGGAAMELRLGLMARATRDFDVSFRQLAADMLSRLDEAFEHPHRDFEVTRTQPTPVGDTSAQRLDLELAYRGRSWQTIQLEIAPAEGAAGQEIDRVPGVPLEHVGLQGIDHVPCVSIRYQIAQKLHACTEDPAPGASNDRSRDLIDLLLLRGLLREATYSACVRGASKSSICEPNTPGHRRSVLSTPGTTPTRAKRRTSGSSFATSIKPSRPSMPSSTRSTGATRHRRRWHPAGLASTAFGANPMGTRAD